MAQEFKLKGVSNLDLQDGSMKQVEVEGVDGGKVRLSKVNGKVHDTSGAPREKGVLAPNGCITCPGHGAKFSVTTGDIEEAPAPDPLTVYELVEKDGAVFIKSSADTIKTNRRRNEFSCAAAASTEEKKIVVVGGGSGAFGFLQALRENGSKTPITLISIDRTKLSKALNPDAGKLLLRQQPWFDAAAITTVSDTATAVDFAKKSVTTASSKTYPYTNLVLATGGTPKRLPLPGFKDLGNIFVLRTAKDVADILAAAGEKAEKGQGKRVVVVGSSFIGMEAGNGLAGQGHRVTIVGMESAPLEAVLGAQVGNVARANLEKAGVEFKMEAGVDKATPSDADASKVGAVHLKDGTALPADLVVLGVGVRPATDFLKDSGVPLEKDGSFTVGANFDVPNADGVYAIGDIATYPYLARAADKQPVRIEHWNVAQNAGRSVGRLLATGKTDAPAAAVVPVFWSALGAQLRYCGHARGLKSEDDVLIKGDLKEGKFAAYYTEGDEVVAVASMSMDPVMSKCADLMGRGKMLGRKELEGGKDPLQVM